MLYFLAILSGILPALILVAFIYWQDKYQREPMKWIAKSFWFGILACGGAIVMEMLWPEPKLNTMSGTLYYSFVVISFSEEMMKYLFFWLLVRGNPYFDERMDGIVYAACVGMGFAGLENIGYLLVNLDNLAALGIARGLLSVPGHFFYAVFMGYYYSLGIYGYRRHRRLYFLLAFLVPFLFHGAFDSIVLAADLSETHMMIAAGTFIVLFVAMGIFVHRHMMRLLRADNKLIHKKGVKERA